MQCSRARRQATRSVCTSIPPATRSASAGTDLVRTGFRKTKERAAWARSRARARSQGPGRPHGRIHVVTSEPSLRSLTYCIHRRALPVDLLPRASATTHADGSFLSATVARTHVADVCAYSVLAHRNSLGSTGGRRGVRTLAPMTAAMSVTIETQHRSNPKTVSR